MNQQENSLNQAEIRTAESKGKVRGTEKVSYFFGNLGELTAASIMSSFLLIFYTDIVKLNPAAVGTLFLIARIFDSVNDVFIGYIIDHLPATRWGRFRPWVAVLGIIAAVNFCVLWLGPSMATTGKLAIAYVTYLLMGITYSGMDVSLGSLLPCMTYDDKERNSLSIVKGLATIIGNGIPVVVMVPLVAMFPTPRQGYHTIIVVVSILTLIFTAICAAGVRERVVPAKKEKYPVSVTLKILFKTPPIAVYFLAVFTIMAGMQIRGGSVMYYLTYNLGNAGLMSAFSAGTLVAMLLGIVVFPKIATKTEKKYVMVACFIITAVGFLSTYLIPYKYVTLIILSNAFACFGEGGFTAVYSALQADLVDYVEWKHGYRAEGAVVSLNAFVMKLGMALGGAVPAYILAMYGYQTGSAKQSPATLSGILSGMSTIPFVLVIVGLVILCFMKLSKSEMQKIREELSSRSNSSAEKTVEEVPAV
ncbi:MAG TPA: glycoside-pentoside-hexuronide (GPH):cation symporter [Caproiciproducens sp.]|nr:glycoside-pentoside-hexuronide (GPH):cation symporter [Caproiciproducens sp.]